MSEILFQFQNAYKTTSKKYISVTLEEKLKESLLFVELAGPDRETDTTDPLRRLERPRK